MYFGGKGFQKETREKLIKSLKSKLQRELAYGHSRGHIREGV
jgi:hypothetical protein